MARAPNEKAIKAEELFKKGYKLINIAKELEVPDGTVRRWKKTYNWDNERSGKNSERSDKVDKKKKSNKEPTAEEVKEVLENTELTDKQRLFCIYYIKYFNATKAYECKYDVANAEGYKLLVNPCIKEEINKLKRNKLNRAMLSEEDIFQRYIDIAFTDMNDFMEFGQKEVLMLDEKGQQVIDEEGNPQTFTVDYAHFKNSSEVDGALISEVSKGKDGAKIKLQDKMKALQWLSDRMDLLPTETKFKLKSEEEKLKMAREKLELEKDQADLNNKDTELKIIVDYGDENGSS